MKDREAWRAVIHGVAESWTWLSNWTELNLGLSMCGIMSSANSDRFTSYFTTCIPFISFSCLIAMVGTPNTVLNKSSESRHPCLVPDLRGNAFSFSPLSMLPVSLSYIAFIVFSYVPSISLSGELLIIKSCWILANALSACIEMIMWCLSLLLLLWFITWIAFFT